MAQSTLSRRFSEIIGVILFASALVTLVALASYTPTDPVWFFNTGSEQLPANLAGRIGAFLAELSFQLLGYSAYLLPAVLAVIGWHYFWCRAFDAPYTKMVGAALLLACTASFLALAFGSLDLGGRPFRAGGYAGDWLSASLAEYLNRTGSIILILTLLFLAMILSTQFSLGRAFSATGAVAHERATMMVASWRERREERRREEQRQQIIRRQAEKAGAKTAPAVRPGATAAMLERRRAEEVAEEYQEADAGRGSRPAAAMARPTPKPTPAINKRPSPPAPAPLPLPEPERAPAERRRSGFTLPPLSLLDAPRGERKIDERELMDGARLLEEKCREFAVEGTVVQIHPGPVVTTYEFKPDAGVKYAKVTSLAEDLCLAMQAESVLIERIPGKSTVGIQIPSPNRDLICLRELLESDVYRRSTSKLTVTLGKTVHGEPFASDLATMPHLLIAGSTGAGKSVCVNAMLTGILYRATPEDVRLILVDPKRLELGVYEDVPHLLTPVVVDPKRAANALRWAVREMEERYKTLASQGVRNIDQFNRNVRAAQAEGNETLTDKEGNPLRPLPFILVVIDELADLMMVAGNEVEESICRLAQMARAVGIHLILATQRPSVDVITGLIKANLPARISFRVSSKTDSRTILDANGAEQLLGKGDMLYLPPASSRIIRLHGPYISEQESARLASFLRKQGKPEYDQTITADDKAAGETVDFDKDDLYDEAARIVVSSGQPSISYLQRRLRIGFSRAARLVDMMEAEGLVSPPNNGKREVLVTKDYFEEVDAQLR
ncbi:MAG TPA: DNA translocase FtsK 4TM domain-containing protein [Vicinamibacterales bacterium]|nr:DNA translocase FtsK 4TM domain-containing protein [Vicinamibacterales bacterium]